MTQHQAKAIYRVSDNIRWVQDANQVIVVDDHRRCFVILRAAEATIWGWLTLNYPYARLLAAVGALWTLSQAEADQRLRALLQRWSESGLLAVKARNING